MIKINHIAAIRKPIPANSNKRAGKPKYLKPKEIIEAFSQPDAVFGKTEGGVYVFAANASKALGHRDDITLMLFCVDEDSMKIKTVIDLIFSDESECAPSEGEVDMRRWVEGKGAFSGPWVADDGGGFSFAILANAGYQSKFKNAKEAFNTVFKIIDIAESRMGRDR